MANYCENCGIKLSKDDIFCNNCGARIIHSKSSTSTDSNYASVKRTYSTTKLYRSRTDRWIWGVCGGLGRHFNIDPLIIRIGFILAFFGWGTGLLVYILLTIFIEEEPQYLEAQRYQRDNSSNW